VTQHYNTIFLIGRATARRVAVEIVVLWVKIRAPNRACMYVSRVSNFRYVWYKQSPVIYHVQRTFSWYSVRIILGSNSETELDTWVTSAKHGVVK
jgi:hypothetical protein